jgi:hypothetical protein
MTNLSHGRLASRKRICSTGAPARKLSMADIFFKCTGCGQNLLIEDTAVGQTYDCLECGGQMTIPAPVSEVECTGCGQSLKVAAGMPGESVRCPNCREPVTVPSEERPRVKLKGEGVPPPLPVAAAAGAGAAECPSCHAPVMAEAVICVQCGLNLQTGKKMTAGTVTASREEIREQKESRQKLIKNIVLIVVVVGILAFALPRLWDVFFPPAPQYARPAPVATPAVAKSEKPATPAVPIPGPMPGMPGMPGMLGMPPRPPGQTAAVAVAAAPTVPPGPMMPPGFAMPMPPGGPTSPPVTMIAPAPVTNVVVTPPSPPPKPPPVLLTADDLRKLGPLEKLAVAGTTYKNVRWTRVSLTEAFFFHSGGAASVPIVKLLPALKEQYAFEPPKHE